MTKTLLSVFLILFTINAWACKPSPLPECKKRHSYVDQHKFEGLSELVKTYQGILTKTLKRPQVLSSCFNNHFAVFYVNQFREELKEHKGKTCEDQIERVRNEINKLVDKKSEEFKTISNTSDKKHLKREAKKVKIAMNCLP